MQNIVSLSDWDYVRRMQAMDAPVPYDPDDDDELYDPNDGAAVRAFWMQGVREGRVTRGIGKDAVVMKPEDFGWDK